MRCRCFEHKKDTHVQLSPYQQHGHGTMKWTDGAVYQGQWQNGKRHGKGVMRYGSSDSTWEDGDVFEGIWRWNEIADGFEGTMTFADGGLYVGKWFKGLQHNGGIYTYPNGDVFEGEFKNGARLDAHGKMKYANGDIYVGQWAQTKDTAKARCNTQVEMNTQEHGLLACICLVSANLLRQATYTMESG